MASWWPPPLPEVQIAGPKNYTFLQNMATNFKSGRLNVVFVIVVTPGSRKICVPLPGYPSLVVAWWFSWYYLLDQISKMISFSPKLSARKITAT